MITYFLNWMGPISLKWYTDNNLVREGDIVEYYGAGRIDVSGMLNDDYYEIAVPPMKMSSWHSFDHWLSEYSSEIVLSLNELVQVYEEYTDKKIEWR